MHHFLTMSASDAIARVHQAFAGDNVQEQSEWAAATLQNAAALELIMTRITHSTSIDVNLMLRLLSTRTYQLRETYEVDRRPLWFLDWFRNTGLIFPLEQGTQALVNRLQDYQPGEVRFVGDKSNDWPTEGGRMETASLRPIKHFAKSVEYGIIELWQEARNGRDIVAERVMDALYDLDFFINKLIAEGSPMHGVYGFLGHPDIPQTVVPPTATAPGAATQWPAKTPSEVLFDLNAARDFSRVDSNYNEIADTAIISDSRYSFINSAEIGTNGDTILSRWMRNQQTAQNGGLQQFQVFPPYDNAGPGGTPIMTVGNFTSENIEFPLLPPVQLPAEYHTSKWKIGFIGAASSVTIKRTGRFRTYTGI